eukprot:gene7188-8349_t
MECAPIKPRDGCSVLLVVDDYPENLISMRALLQREDWHVVTAASGVEALGLLLEHDVDLVLLDVMMPGMDGFEVARLMRGSQRTQMTPIIFLSAHAQSPAAMLEGYASGAIDYLLKPFDPNILKPKVQALLEHQRNRRALQRLSHDLESARAFNASVLDNAAEGILVVGEDGVISYANPAISRLINAPVAEIQGAEFLGFLQKPHVPGWSDSALYEGYKRGETWRLHDAIFTWIYQQVAAQRQAWAGVFSDELVLSVSLSSSQFNMPNLASQLQQVLERHGLQGRQLEVEISEESLMHNLDESTKQLKLLRREQVEWLKANGCQFIQGPQVAPPLIADEIADWRLRAAAR